MLVKKQYTASWRLPCNVQITFLFSDKEKKTHHFYCVIEWRKENKILNSVLVEKNLFFFKYREQVFHYNPESWQLKCVSTSLMTGADSYHIYEWLPLSLHLCCMHVSMLSTVTYFSVSVPCLPLLACCYGPRLKLWASLNLVTCQSSARLVYSRFLPHLNSSIASTAFLFASHMPPKLFSKLRYYVDWLLMSLCSPVISCMHWIYLTFSLLLNNYNSSN